MMDLERLPNALKLGTTLAARVATDSVGSGMVPTTQPAGSVASKHARCCSNPSLRVAGLAGHLRGQPSRNAHSQSPVLAAR